MVDTHQVRWTESKQNDIQRSVKTLQPFIFTATPDLLLHSPTIFFHFRDNLDNRQP